MRNPSDVPTIVRTHHDSLMRYFRSIATRVSHSNSVLARHPAVECAEAHSHQFASSATPRKLQCSLPRRHRLAHTKKILNSPPTNFVPFGSVLSAYWLEKLGFCRCITARLRLQARLGGGAEQCIRMKRGPRHETQPPRQLRWSTIWWSTVAWDVVVNCSLGWWSTV